MVDRNENILFKLGNKHAQKHALHMHLHQAHVGNVGLDTCKRLGVHVEGACVSVCVEGVCARGVSPHLQTSWCMCRRWERPQWRGE